MLFRLKQFQLRNMEQLCSCLRVILGQAKAISEGRKTLIYTVQETNSTTPNPSAVHTVRLAEITDINPITRLIALAETEVVGSNVKAFFMCDLCMFTIDLTSILVTPGSTQKNELLIAVVLEHLVPHTESLLSVIANTAGSKTFNFKMEVKARVTTERTGHRKIVLSLQKKFVSSQSGLEIVLEKDEERTLNQLRASVRADRQKNFVNIRTKSDGGKNLFPQFSNKVLQDTRRPFKILQETSRYSRNFKSYEKLKGVKKLVKSSSLFTFLLYQFHGFFNLVNFACLWF